MTVPQLEGFKERIEATLKDSSCPGMSMAIVKDGETVFANGFGYRDVERQLPAGADTQYPIGSCSKSFTAMSVALMVDEGKLGWDTPVRRYMTGFSMFDPVVSERLTPRDMLTHRSGLARHEFAWYASSFSREELIERLRYLEPNKDLRELFQYNNLLYMTAGYLAGNVVGMQWEDLVKKRIFEPLGMLQSNLSVEDLQRGSDYAVPYQEIKNEIKRIPFRDINTIGPAGSINSSVKEMANWVKLHLSKGKFEGQQILSEAVFDEMHAPQIVAPATITEIAKDETIHWLYAMGWWTVSYRGHEMWLHEGGIDGFTATTYLLPRLGIGVVGLSNLSSNFHVVGMTLEAIDRMAGLTFIDWHGRIGSFMTRMKQAAEEGRMKSAAERVPDTPPTHALSAYTGSYEHPAYGTFKVCNEGDVLVATFFKQDFPLEHYHYDVFQFHLDTVDMDFKVQFHMDGKGDINRLSIPFTPGVKDIVFERVAEEKLKEKSFLEQFAGEYELMGQTIMISLKGESLLASIPGQGDLELLPYREMIFNVKGISAISITFRLDEQGNVVEALINQAGTSFVAKRK
jgi:CubicO group peptidase (beta-lactamase class C family)